MPGIEARPRLPFPINPLAARPRVAAREAAETAALLWGIRGRAEPLSGERDANFLIEDDEGERFVLKVGAAAESVVRFALQDELVRHARKRDPGLLLPAALPTPAGDQAVTRRFGPDECPVRLFPYFDGVPLSTFRRRPAALLASVGRLVGRLQRALAGFDHPGLEVQEIPWAPGQASNVIEAASQVLGEGETGRLYRRVAAWVGAELSALMTLPSAALQNDANDDNSDNDNTLTNGSSQ